MPRMLNTPPTTPNPSTKMGCQGNIKFKTIPILTIEMQLIIDVINVKNKEINTAYYLKTIYNNAIILINI